MAYTTLVSAAETTTLLGTKAPMVLQDCRFDLADTADGERDWAAGHLPGALYAHLDRDLSGAKTGRNGRHPLPAFDTFAVTAGRWGVAPGVQVVVYDAQGGTFASRAWWLLRWLSHEAVAVLDGGLPAWLAAGGALDTAAPAAAALPPYPAAAPAMPTIGTEALLSSLGRVPLLDARAAERFRGEVEPLDPVAGHIPGATLRFFRDNLGADGRFKTPAALRSEFAALGAGAGEVVHSCGSGVVACHNLLAMVHAGYDGAVLYPGSWSEWCSDPSRPVARA